MQGVESMGSALEVSPSAFGGFTIREDFVSAMRLSIRHTQSMPAEGKPDSDLQALTVIKAYTLLSYAAPCSDAIRSSPSALSRAPPSPVSRQWATMLQGLSFDPESAYLIR